MHDVSFIQDLAVVMIVAGLVTVLFHRLKQPVVLGYILAGVIVGPYTPPFALIHDQETIETLAELGIVFLMFSLGLHFSLKKLRQVGRTALIAASLEILFMAWIGYEVGRFSGWSSMDSIFLGAILSISSTTIIVKALNELGRAKEKFAELIFGILIVEDILAVAMLALLSSIAMTGSLNAGEVVMTVGKLGIFLTTVLVVGLIAVPRLLSYVAKFKSQEMLLVAVLALCFGVSLLAVKLGYSIALGAFIIGAVIAESRQNAQIATLVEPIRDLFSAVFFVSIGLLIQPRLLAEYALPIAIITLAVILGKALTCSFGTFVAGHDTRTSLRVGMGLAQIGEFSFIIATLGVTLKVTSEFLYPIAVTVSALTTLCTPYLIKSSDTVVGWFDRIAPQSLVGYLDLYSRWVKRRGSSGGEDITRPLIRKLLFKLALDVTLITAIFAVIVGMSGRIEAKLPDLPDLLDRHHGFVWLCAMLAALPLFVAAFRKLDILGMLTAEACLPDSNAGPRSSTIRTLIANTVLLAGSLGLGLWVLLISAAVLPPWPLVAVFFLLLAAIVFFFWRSLLRVYAKARHTLEENLSPSP